MNDHGKSAGRNQLVSDIPKESVQNNTLSRFSNKFGPILGERTYPSMEDSFIKIDRKKEKDVNTCHL